MFERYTESARRVLFFARYEVTQLGGVTIEPEHILLGVLRETPHAVARFAKTGSAEAIRMAIQDAQQASQHVSTSVEIPFSRDSKAVLESAAAESNLLHNHFIGPAHLVLGILLKTSGAAARALSDAGVSPHALRDDLRSTPHPEPDASAIGHAATGVPRGAVSRQWTGVVQTDRAGDYLRHLNEETIPALRRLPGLLGVSICRREVADGTEFQVTTTWRSLDAIAAFAGEDVTRAVVPAAAAAMMIRYDERAVHYEIVQ